jgi:arabinan endo-1,5-alpha-L-arabinosidase
VADASGPEHDSSWRPAYPRYFADPFVLRTDEGYVAYGTVPPHAEQEGTGGGSSDDGRVFRLLVSPDLRTWDDAGAALERLPKEYGEDYWAPEVAFGDGRYHLYYSVGRGDAGHHLRVATADSPAGPFRDVGVNLTPGERFAIDPHPFQDADGRWYMFFARDVLDGDRVGTMLAVDPMTSMTELAGEARTILRPDGDWQIYERGRTMYGRTVDWHTLEGPAVLEHEGTYYCFFSGGSWKNESYGVSWAEAAHPLGPWVASTSPQRILATREPDLVGPGHNSFTTAPDGSEVIVFHAWDAARGARLMRIAPLRWTAHGPRVLP